ncbi:MAG: nucleotidyltransferase domain-containing protein [Pseudomonadota bacterium]
MKFGLSKCQISELAAIFASFSEIADVIIFGSRAMGNFKKGSDVDLALKGRISAALVGRLSRKLNAETNLPYKFDVIDYDKISNSELKKHIDAFGCRLYRRRKA